MTLIYKIVHNPITIDKETVDIHMSTGLVRNEHNLKIDRVRIKDSGSPFWNSTVVRSIPDWNSLPAAVAEAETLESHKDQLAAPKP